MATKKRGQVLKSADEIEADRRERARREDCSPPPLPEDAATLPPPLAVMMAPLTVGDHALNVLMAENYARMATEAGMLPPHTTIAQAIVLVMRGFEMGIPPLRALNELYFAPTEQGGLEIVEEASLIRSRVARSGLGVIEPLPEKCNGTIATVRAIRHDRFGHRHAEFSYSLDDATHDGLMLKRNWQSGANREALLTARATTKAARAWFSDIEGSRYTGEELGAGHGHTTSAAPGDGPPASPPPSGALGKPVPAPPPVSPAPADPPTGVAAPAAAGASDAGGPHPPVAPPPPLAAAPPPTAEHPAPPSGGPPAADGLPPTATKEEKLSHYARVSEMFNRPWTTNAGMSRDPQPVAILTHGASTDQLTKVLDYVIEGRKGFARASEAAELVLDHLGKLGIDTSLLPLPYCLFALTREEARIVVEGLQGFAEQIAANPDAPEEDPTAPPNPLAEVQPGQAHSWQEASEKFEAMVGKLAGTVTRGDLLGLLSDSTGKTFYELSPDELWKSAADLDMLSQNPTIFAQAVSRMRMTRGG